MDYPAYVLVTPARNEEKHIEATIQSVLRQTILPRQWVIVSDNSTDKTDGIADKYARLHDFITLFRPSRESDWNMGSRALTILAGIEQVKGIKFEYLGVLDADITLEPDYYERVLAKMRENPRLGIAAGIYREMVDGKLRSMKLDEAHTPGALQLFRRECYEEIGGYIPLRNGGVDSVAEGMARMRGWETRSFPDIVALHHRPLGTGGGSGTLRARFRAGLAEYERGSHPLFAFVRAGYRIMDPPVCLGSIARILGYCSAWIRNNERQVPEAYCSFIQDEQLGRLGLRRKNRL